MESAQNVPVRPYVGTFECGDGGVWGEGFLVGYLELVLLSATYLFYAAIEFVVKIKPNLCT